MSRSGRLLAVYVLFTNVIFKFSLSLSYMLLRFDKNQIAFKLIKKNYSIFSDLILQRGIKQKHSCSYCLEQAWARYRFVAILLHESFISFIIPFILCCLSLVPFRQDFLCSGQK